MFCRIGEVKILRLCIILKIVSLMSTILIKIVSSILKFVSKTYTISLPAPDSPPPPRLQVLFNLKINDIFLIKFVILKKCTKNIFYVIFVKLEGIYDENLQEKYPKSLPKCSICLLCNNRAPRHKFNAPKTPF